MTTITLKINERTKAGKAIKAIIDVLASQDGVEIVENSNDKSTKKSSYNSEFVAEIIAAEKRGEYTKLDPDNIWGSILSE